MFTRDRYCLLCLFFTEIIFLSTFWKVLEMSQCEHLGVNFFLRAQTRNNILCDKIRQTKRMQRNRTCTKTMNCMDDNLVSVMESNDISRSLRIGRPLRLRMYKWSITNFFVWLSVRTERNPTSQDLFICESSPAKLCTLSYTKVYWFVNRTQ